MSKFHGKTVIVDLDGTIADSEHRLHHIKTKPKKWNKFNKLAYDDSVIDDIHFLVRSLWLSGCKVVVCTAREESGREETERWLYCPEKANLKDVVEKVYMRPKGDYREDSIVKIETLLPMIVSDGYDVFLVLEDRNRVVEAWRNAGLRCLHVCWGDY
jgi:hypothetical protein